MQLTLRRRTLGLAGFVLVLAVVVVGITALAILSLQKERATQRVRSLFLSADRSRQELMRQRDVLHFTRADQNLVRADSVFRQSVSRLGETGVLPAGTRDSIEAYRSVLFGLLKTMQARGLGDGHGLVGRFRITAQTAADLLRESGQSDLLAQLLEVRQHEQDFLRSGAKSDRSSVRRGVGALKRRVRRAARFSTLDRDRFLQLMDEYLAQFQRVGDLTQRERRLDARLSALYDQQAATLERAARHQSLLANRYEWAAGLTILAVALLALLAAAWTARTLVRPVLALQQAAERIAAGDETLRLPVASDHMDREIGHLAQALDKVRIHVAERRSAEEKLRAARQFTETILESVGEGIFAVNRDLRYVKWNAYAAAFTGRPAEKVLGEKVTDVFPEARSTGIVACYWQALAGETAHSGDVSLRHAETGEVRWYAASYAPLHDSGGAVSGVVGTFHDVTARKRTEDHLHKAKEEAEETARLKSSFVANMSHELRTPLTSVLGFAEALVEVPAEGSGAQVEEFARYIRRSGERLERTMNAVLELSRLEAGSIETELETVALGAEAREAVRLLQPLAEDQPVTLSVEAPPPGEDVYVCADSAKLGQVIDNLVSNAVKFTEEGRVSVEVARRREGGALHVRDTGIGIDEAFLPHLYEAFRQESSGLARDFEGAGLGLAITHRLVHLMDGDIEVTSEKGEGTCFTVVLPQATPAGNDRLPQATGASSPPADASASPVASPTVLVIEDNRSTRALAAHILHSTYDVTCACSADVALQEAQQEPFAALLIDIDLGTGPGGTRLLERLRALPTCTDAHAVAFTAHTMPGDAERLRQAGFDGYLAKPFSKSELLQTLAPVLHPAEV